jgi:hypothetical protein
VRLDHLLSKEKKSLNGLKQSTGLSVYSPQAQTGSMFSFEGFFAFRGLKKPSQPDVSRSETPGSSDEV